MRHQTHDRHVNAGCGKFVLQRLGEQIADLALAGGATDIQRLPINHVGGAFRAQQLRTHLRPIAMRDDQVVSQTDKPDDGLGGAASVGQLLGNRAFFAGTNERIATNRDQRSL